MDDFAEQLRAAGRTSPTAGQSWFQDGWEKARRWTSERLDGLKGWLAEHAGFLRERLAARYLARLGPKLRDLLGRTGTLLTVWQLDKGSTTPRMITNLLKVHQ
jgi:hypothetical protein